MSFVCNVIYLNLLLFIDKYSQMLDHSFIVLLYLLFTVYYVFYTHACTIYNIAHVHHGIVGQLVFKL